MVEELKVQNPKLNTNTTKAAKSSETYNPFCAPVFNANPFLMPSMDFSLPFATIPMAGFDFSNMFNGDFMSTMSLFNFFMQGDFSDDFKEKTIDTKYNTNHNIASLEKAYNPDLGNSLANIAEKNAKSNNTKGYCFRGVRQALEKADISEGEIRGESAYQAADMLANHKNFKEVEVSKDELKSLPAGCVIVWDKSSGHKHGHIAVTLGDGKEASDHVQNIKLRNASHRVFVPISSNTLNTES